MWRKGNPHALLVGKYIGVATMEISMKLPQNFKNRHLRWSSNSTSGYLAKGNKNTNLGRHMHSHVYCSIIYNSQDVETIWVFISEKMDKENVTHIYIYTHTRDEIVLSHKKRKSCHLQHGWSHMDGPQRHYSKWNTSNKRKTNIVWIRVYVKCKNNSNQKTPKIHRCKDWWRPEMGIVGVSKMGEGSQKAQTSTWV